MKFDISDLVQTNLDNPQKGHVFIRERRDNQNKNQFTHMDINYGGGIYSIRFENPERKTQTAINCGFACLEYSRMIKGKIKTDPLSLFQNLQQMRNPFFASLEERCRDVRFESDSYSFCLDIWNSLELNERCTYWDYHPFKCISRYQQSATCYGANLFPLLEYQTLFDMLGRILRNMIKGIGLRED